MNSLKIDRSFIMRLDNKENQEIIKAILTIAGNLKMEVTAEGIETKEQLSALRKLKCTYGQGYYFAKPLPVKDVETLLKKGPAWEYPEIT